MKRVPRTGWTVTGSKLQRPFCFRIAVVVLSLLIAGSHLAAEDQSVSARPDWRVQTGVVLGVNPTVFGLSARAGYSLPILQGINPDSILWRTARVEPGIDVLANPSFTDVSARIYLEPIAFFDVRAEAGFRAHYTAFGYGLVPLDSYSAPLPAVTGNDHDREDGTGMFIRIAPRLKGAAGPFLAANTLVAARYEYSDLPSGAGYLEESVTLRVIAESDWVLQNTAQLLYQFRSVDAPFAGIGLEHTTAWVPAAASAQDPLQRTALLGVYAHELGRDTVLQTAVLAGGYPTEEPFSRDKLFALVAVTLVSRF